MKQTLDNTDFVISMEISLHTTPHFLDNRVTFLKPSLNGHYAMILQPFIDDSFVAGNSVTNPSRRLLHRLSKARPRRTTATQTHPPPPRAAYQNQSPWCRASATKCTSSQVIFGVLYFMYVFYVYKMYRCIQTCQKIMSSPRLRRIVFMYRQEPKDPLILARYLARRYILRNGSFSWLGEPTQTGKIRYIDMTLMRYMYW